MTANQPNWPREWLMTDERIGDRLWDAIAALPAGAGVVFRHYGTPDEERSHLGRRIADICLENRLLLAVARDPGLAASLGAALVHNPASSPPKLSYSRSAHSVEEARSAVDAGASLIFLAPLFPTLSHPGRRPLSRDEARRIVESSPIPVIALGGMNRARFEEIRAGGFYGWAGIGAWLGEIRT